MQNSKRKNETRIAPRSMPPTSSARQAREAGFGVFGYTESAAHEALSSIKAKPDLVASAVAAPALVVPKTRKKERVKREREALAKFDMPFFTIVIVLFSFGIVMMFSASYAYALNKHDDGYYFAQRQITFGVIGILLMLIISRINYEIMLKKWIIVIGAGISIGLMVLTRLIGVETSGAMRWIEIGSITFQPSELLKFAVIVVMAYWMHKKYDKKGKLKKNYLPVLGFLLVACFFTALQRHLSGTIIIFIIGFIVLFVGDCKVKDIVRTLIIFLVGGIVLILIMRALGYDYMSERIAGWRNPEADIRDSTFQTYQSLIAIGSGGIFGLGLGNSRQKYAYLPASHNDFIFSIICEELGFVGAVLVILLFVMFVVRGFYIAVCARNKFGMLLAVGITSQLGIQALLNIGVVTNAVPNTGISLPFFSYGGTALLMQLMSIGVVLNISRKAAIE
ncbi:MAG: putative lipid II flippase FtsW [Oscillospiraceae bacterium]|jgi:cell division protein FtsW|nr:putative lipid II flippase FtsW [Oscillospiraceae bacterium]